MKRPALSVVMMLSLLLISCNPLEIFRTTKPSNDGYWYVKNQTSETLRLRQFSEEGEIRDDDPLNPGDSIRIKMCGVEEGLYFGFEWLCRSRYDGYLRVEIRSSTGALLKNWPLTGQGHPEDRFYEELSWRYYHPFRFVHSWVFDLLPEDLEPQNAASGTEPEGSAS